MTRDGPAWDNGPMRLGSLALVLAAACGGTSGATPDAPASGPDAASDASACQPAGAIGAFYRRTNPRLVAGQHTFGDGDLDLSIADPDLRWDDASATWQLYYAAAHAPSFGAASAPVIRHATSPDLASWTLDDAPALAAATDPAAWDHAGIEAPTVVYVPDAPADRRYLMLYAGASGAFPYPGYAFPDDAIGAAVSADGVTFTRITAADSPHGQAGLVLTGQDAYPGTTGAIVADPEVAYVGGVYHLWFSSFACIGAKCETASARGVGHATSTDGIHWSVAEAPVRSLLAAAIDPTSGGAQPSVVYDAVRCRWEMWLSHDAAGDTDAQPIVFDNTAGVWHATSYDAQTWSISYVGARDLAWMASSPGEHLGLAAGADVAGKSTARYMLYVGFDDQDVPSGSTLPDRSTQGSEPGVMALDLAARDAPN